MCLLAILLVCQDYVPSGYLTSISSRKNDIKYVLTVANLTWVGWVFIAAAAADVVDLFDGQVGRSNEGRHYQHYNNGT